MPGDFPLPAWSAGRRFGLEAALFAVVFLLALQFSALHILRSAPLPEASLPRLVAGTAVLPYQRRILVPWIVGGLHALGEGARIDITRGVEIASALGAWLAVRRLLGGVIGGGPAAGLAALALPLLLPLPFVLLRQPAVWQPCDIPAIALAAAGMASIRERRWAAYYPLLALAALNSESAALLPLVFAFDVAREMPTKRLVAHLAAQAAICAGIELALRAAFAANGGPAKLDAEALRANLALLRDGPGAVALAASLAFLGGAIALLARRAEERFARRALQAAAVFVVSTSFTLRLDEPGAVAVLLPLAPLVLASLARSLDARRPGAILWDGGCART